MVLDGSRPRIVYRGEELVAETIHVAIPRIGASITGYGLSVVNQFDMMGVPVLNDAIPIYRSRDKLRALQFLARFGDRHPADGDVPLPRRGPAVGRDGRRPPLHHQAPARHAGRRA